MVKYIPVHTNSNLQTVTTRTQNIITIEGDEAIECIKHAIGISGLGYQVHVEIDDGALVRLRFSLVEQTSTDSVLPKPLSFGSGVGGNRADNYLNGGFRAKHEAAAEALRLDEEGRN